MNFEKHMKTILIIAAHPDDEVLGCGGTIIRHVDSGDEVNVLFMSDGVTSRNKNELQHKNRNNSALVACSILGTQEPIFLNFPDNKMDSLALLDVVQTVEKIINELKPETIYTHHSGDLNIDHRITHQAVMTACRPQPNFSVKEIYSFEVLSSTEWQTQDTSPFLPNYFIDITSFIENKRRALNAYVSEMYSEPHSRSIENILRLNAVRGNSVGLDYAEAFMVLRKITR
jgi:LmbE family N-acetylglucosaminyl deacetylase